MNFLESLMIGDSWVSTAIIYIIASVALVIAIRNLARIASFSAEVKGELRKAIWPWDPDPKAKGFRKYKELIDSTIVVLIAVILLAAFVQLWDFLQIQIVGLFTDFFL